MTAKRYTYRIEGLDADGRIWATEGEVTAEFAEAITQAMRQSFDRLTQGKAIYGEPGKGCRGPYDVTRVLIDRPMQDVVRDLLARLPKEA